MKFKEWLLQSEGEQAYHNPSVPEIDDMYYKDEPPVQIQGGPVYRPARVDPRLLDKIAAGRPADYRGSSYEFDPDDEDYDPSPFGPPVGDPSLEYPQSHEDSPDYDNYLYGDEEPIETEDPPPTHRQTKQTLRSRYPMQQMSDTKRRSRVKARHKLLGSLGDRWREIAARKQPGSKGQYGGSLVKKGGWNTYQQNWKNHRDAQYRPVDMIEEPEE